MGKNTRNLIDIYIDGDQWCAIYPMGSDLMSCTAVAFAPVNIRYSDCVGRERDYGKYDALNKLKENNPNLPTTSFYCEHWD